MKVFSLFVTFSYLPVKISSLTCNTYIGSDSTTGGLGHQDCLPGVDHCIMRQYNDPIFNVRTYGMSCDDFPYYCKDKSKDACCMVESAVLGPMAIRCSDENWDVGNKWSVEGQVHKADFQGEGCYCRCDDPTSCNPPAGFDDDDDDGGSGGNGDDVKPYFNLQESYSFFSDSECKNPYDSDALDAAVTLQIKKVEDEYDSKESSLYLCSLTSSRNELDKSTTSPSNGFTCEPIVALYEIGLNKCTPKGENMYQKLLNVECSMVDENDDCVGMSTGVVVLVSVACVMSTALGMVLTFVLLKQRKEKKALAHKANVGLQNKV